MLLASLNPAALTATDIADAVRIDGTVFSRSDLVGAATSVAERAGGAGRVAILAAPTAATVLAVTGCLIAGVPFVPVPADVGAAERRHMLTDSGVRAWLGAAPPTDSESEGLQHIPVRVHARSWHRYPEPSPDATAMIIYTSGTTGLPKGVVLSRRAIAADLDALAEAWQWTADAQSTASAPPAPRSAASNSAGWAERAVASAAFISTWSRWPSGFPRDGTPRGAARRRNRQ